MLNVQIRKKIHDFLTLELTESFEAGKITTIIGGSGAGKSSVLNIISGLQTIDEGTMTCESQTFACTNRDIHLPIHLRRVGYVRQQPYLFPHLNVYENLTYKMAYEDESLLNHYVTLFELTPFIHKKVSALSGGEAQRVNLVRTLLTKPLVLLLDEPFSALDVRLRQTLNDEVKKLKQLNIPIILVTHDLDEAIRLSDEIMLLQNGRIIERLHATQFFTQFKRFETAKYLGLKNMNHELKTVILPQDIAFSEDGQRVIVQKITPYMTHVEVTVMDACTHELFYLVCSIQEVEERNLEKNPKQYIKIRRVLQCR